MASEEEDLCYTCDSCGEETDDPISIHLPVAGKNRSPIDLCVSCACGELQRMVDRLGHEHGSSMLLEIKGRQAKRVPAPKPEELDEEE